MFFRQPISLDTPIGEEHVQVASPELANGTNEAAKTTEDDGKQSETPSMPEANAHKPDEESTVSAPAASPVSAPAEAEAALPPPPNDSVDAANKNEPEEVAFPVPDDEPPAVPTEAKVPQVPMEVDPQLVAEEKPGESKIDAAPESKTATTESATVSMTSEVTEPKTKTTTTESATATMTSEATDGKAMENETRPEGVASEASNANEHMEEDTAPPPVPTPEPASAAKKDPPGWRA